jgi:uncharacterized protein YndB with AHSA1/START domain
MSIEDFETQVEVAANQAEVWRWLTSPGLMGRWMSDEPLVVDSAWERDAWITLSGVIHGIPFINRGIILEWQPNTSFTYSYWSSLSGEHFGDAPENRTSVSFHLAPSAMGTLLSNRISNFPELSVRQHCALYWPPTLQILKAAIESQFAQSA